MNTVLLAKKHPRRLIACSYTEIHRGTQSSTEDFLCVALCSPVDLCVMTEDTEESQSDAEDFIDHKK